MPPSLSELKVTTPSFCFPFKIPDDLTATNNYVGKKRGWEGQWKVHNGSRDKSWVVYKMSIFVHSIGQNWVKFGPRGC
jgi:hypothetical protein